MDKKALHHDRINALDALIALDNRRLVKVASSLEKSKTRWRRTLVHLVRAVHGQDHAIGAPVGEEIHGSSHDERAIGAADQITDAYEQCGQRCEEHRGPRLVHFSNSPWHQANFGLIRRWEGSAGQVGAPMQRANGFRVTHLSMNLNDAIATLRSHEAALRARGIRRAAIFGSIARGQSRPGSDLDIMIEIDPDAHMTVFDYVALKEYITALFDGPVDVVNRDGLKPHLRRGAAANAVYAF